LKSTLESDDLFRQAIARAVNFAHAPSPETVQQFVTAANQAGCQGLINVCQGAPLETQVERFPAGSAALQRRVNALPPL
jgi:hypothetical protein